MYGSVQINCTTPGHAWDNFFGSYSPDNIMKRKKNYLYYIDCLVQLLSLKYNKNIDNIQRNNIINKLDNIIFNAASIGVKRLDGILAFEIEYAKNPKANSWTFIVPTKFIDEKNLTIQGKMYNQGIVYTLKKVLNLTEEKSYKDKVGFSEDSSKIVDDFNSYFYKFCNNRFTYGKIDLVEDKHDRETYWKITIKNRL
jgi:hypothetical protein